MPQSHRPGRGPRQRRRATRTSTAENYDRSFDTPTGPGAAGVFAGQGRSGDDEMRSVVFDDADVASAAAAGEDDPTGEAFYRENMPPHFGTTQ